MIRTKKVEKLSDKLSITKNALDRIKKHQEIADKYDLNIDQILDLSLGDNLFVPPSHIQNIITNTIQSIDPRESYPINYNSFIEEISRFAGVKTPTLYPGITHTQLLQRIISISTKSNDSIILITPDKGVYDVIARNQKLNIQKVSLKDNFELDVNLTLEVRKETSSKAIVFSSPHYPTANQFDESNVLSLVKELEIPVIVDESYVEFGKYSLLNQVQYHDNLTVIRSFSKAWGLGSTSFAYLASDPKYINLLKEKFLIEEIPPIHILATKHILQAPYKFVELINNFIVERKRVIEHLRLLNGLKVFRSDTNFLFIKYKNEIRELYEQLCSKGIIVKTFDKHHTFKDREKSFLVTLGDATTNDRFIVAIIEALETMA